MERKNSTHGIEKGHNTTHFKTTKMGYRFYVAAKVYEGIIDTRIRNIVEPVLNDDQSNFRRNYSIQHHVFTTTSRNSH